MYILGTYIFFLNKLIIINVKGTSGSESLLFKVPYEEYGATNYVLLRTL